MPQVKTQTGMVKLTRTCSLGACPDDRRITELPSSSSHENQCSETKTKSYTDWITRLVRKKGKFCRFSENLKQTLSNGVLLADLILTLTKCEVPGIEKSPLTTESKILNVDRCLVHLQNLGYSTSNLCTQEITGSKPKALSDLLDTLLQAQLQSSNPGMPTPRCARSGPAVSSFVQPATPGPGVAMKRTPKVARPSNQASSVTTQRLNSSINQAKLNNDRARPSRDSAPKAKNSGLPRPSVSTGNTSITYPSGVTGLYRRPSSVSHRSSITSLNTDAACPRSRPLDTVSSTVTFGPNPKLVSAQGSHSYRPSTMSYMRPEHTPQVPLHQSSKSNLQLQSKTVKVNQSTYATAPSEAERSVSLASIPINKQPSYPAASIYQPAGLSVGERTGSEVHPGPPATYPTTFLPYEHERSCMTQTAIVRQTGPNVQLLNNSKNNNINKATRNRANIADILVSSNDSNGYLPTTININHIQVPIKGQPFTAYSTVSPNIPNTVNAIHTEHYTSRTSQYLPHGDHNNCNNVISSRSQFSPLNSCHHSVIQMSLPQPGFTAPGTTVGEVTSTSALAPIYYCHQFDRGHRKEQGFSGAGNVTKSFTFNLTDAETFGMNAQTNCSNHQPLVNQEIPIDQSPATSVQSPFITSGPASLSVGLPSRLPVKRQSSYEISSLSRGSSGLTTSYGLDLSQGNAKHKSTGLSNSHSTASSLSAGDEKAFCDSGISSSSYSKDSACTSPSDNTVVKEESQLAGDGCVDTGNLDTSCCSSVSTDLNSVTRSSTDTVVHEGLHGSDLSGCTTPDSSTLKTESPASTIHSAQFVSTSKKCSAARAARPTTISTSGSVSWLKASEMLTGQHLVEQSDRDLQYWELSSPNKLRMEGHYINRTNGKNPVEMKSMCDEFHQDGGKLIVGSDLANMLSLSVDGQQSIEVRHQVRNWNRARSHTPECVRKYEPSCTTTDVIFQSSELSEPDENALHNTVVRKHPRSNSRSEKQNEVIKKEANGETRNNNNNTRREQRQLIAANCQDWYRKVGSLEERCDEPCRSSKSRCNEETQSRTEIVCTDAEELLSKLSFVSDLNNSGNGWDQNYFSDVESEYAALELVLPFTKSKRCEERPLQTEASTIGVTPGKTDCKPEVGRKSTLKEYAEITPFKRKVIDHFTPNCGVNVKPPVASAAPIHIMAKQPENSRKTSPIPPPPTTTTEVSPQVLQTDAQCPVRHNTRVQSKPPLSSKQKSSGTEDIVVASTVGSKQKSRPLDHVRLPYPTNVSTASPTKQGDFLLSTSLYTASLNSLSSDQNAAIYEQKEFKLVDCPETMNTNRLSDPTTKVSSPQAAATEPTKIPSTDKNTEDDENQSKQIEQLTAVNQLKDSEILELRQMIGQLQQEIDSIKNTRPASLSTFQLKPTRSNSCRTTHSGEQLRMDQETASITSGLSLTASDAQFLFGYPPSGAGYSLPPVDTASPDLESNGLNKRSRWMRTPFAKAFGKRSRSSIDSGDRVESSRPTGPTTATVFTSLGSHLAASEDLTEAVNPCEAQGPEQLRSLVSRLSWQMSCLLAENLRLRRLVIKNPSLLDDLHQETSNKLTSLNHRNCGANGRILPVFVHLDSRPTAFATPADKDNLKRPGLPLPVNRKAKILKIGCIEVAKESTWQTLRTEMLRVMQDHVTFLDSEGHLFTNGCGPTPEKISLNLPNCSTSVDSGRSMTKTLRLTEDNWSEAVKHLTEVTIRNGHLNTTHSPFLTINVDTRETITEQGEIHTLKWLSFDSLLPEEKLKCYLETMENYRTTILCGCPGTFKSKIVRKLADHLLKESDNLHSAMRIFSAKRGATLGSDGEMYNFLSQCLINFEQTGWPKIIVIEDLHHLDDALLTSLHSVAESLTGSWPKILATSDAEMSQIGELNIPASIKIMEHLMDANASAEFLERHLRRKVAQTRLFYSSDPGSQHLCEEEDALLIRIVSWIARVWKSVNMYPCNGGLSGPPLLGLHLFMSCPVDVFSSKTWFLDIWNNLLSPFLFRNNQNHQSAVPSLSSVFDWMIVTWPWISDIGWKSSIGLGSSNGDIGSLSEINLFPSSSLMFGGMAGSDLNAAASQSYLSLDTQISNVGTSSLSRPPLPDNLQCASSSKTRSRNASVAFSTGEPTSVKLQSFS